MTNSNDLAEIAHLLKRTSFSPTYQRVQELAALGWDRAVTVMVDRAAPPQVPSSIPFKNIYPDSDGEDYFTFLDIELQRLGSPNSGLGDRMLVFWHGILTSANSAIGLIPLLFRQYQLLARHALGNFRQLLIDITTDPVMLYFLNGDGSTGDAPNENYARELMELFTLGRGYYQQSDVTAAARALAGWYVEGYPEKEGPFNPDRIRAVFNPDAAYHSPGTFLGLTAQFDVPAIIDRILQQDACARYIARRLFQYFVHMDPDKNSIATLAAVFRGANYEIRPLLSALFRHPDFRSVNARGARARLPLETLLAAAAAFSTPVATFDYVSYLDAVSFWLLEPPNVAGWPLGNRWLVAPQSLARIRLGLAVFNLSGDNPTVAAITKAADPVVEMLRWTSLYHVSSSTWKGLAHAARAVSEPETRARTLLALTVASPEFALA